MAQPEEAGAHRASGGWTAGRRLARTLVFQTLYEMDVSRHRPGAVLQRRLDEVRANEDTAEFARQLLAGVLREREALDGLLQEAATAWPLAQMSPVDRNLLRVGIFECLYTSQQVPVRVAANEAVELAKRFGSDNSARFVNGVLGHLVRRYRPDEDASPPLGSPVQ